MSIDTILYDLLVQASSIPAMYPGCRWQFFRHFNSHTNQGNKTLAGPGLTHKDEYISFFRRGHFMLEGIIFGSVFLEQLLWGRLQWHRAAVWCQTNCCCVNSRIAETKLQNPLSPESLQACFRKTTLCISNKKIAISFLCTLGNAGGHPVPC